MHHVILRDDDTNALTPVDCLERLYRPFLDRGLPVNLAVIPDVFTGTRLPDGSREGYLFPAEGAHAESVPIGRNRELVDYLKANAGFRVIQHGCHHRYLEFECDREEEVITGLERGAARLMEAGLGRPRTFVAPYDRLSRVSLAAVARRYGVISTGWFERRRLPLRWWPRYLWKKIARRAHWRAGGAILLSHPGCLLSYQHPYEGMTRRVRETVERGGLTVLVTHWWEYFRDGRADERFISVLHETAAMLADHPDVRVISFEDLANGVIPLNCK